MFMDEDKFLAIGIKLLVRNVDNCFVNRIYNFIDFIMYKMLLSYCNIVIIS